MSDLSDLAAKIDAMTLDELMGGEGLPVAGGECDTKMGWAKRMGVDKSSQAFKDAWERLEAAKLVEKVRGRLPDRRQSLTLYRCPVLADKVMADSGCHDGDSEQG